MEKLDIEKMSNIDISQDSVKSISDKCNQFNTLKIIRRERQRTIVTKAVTNANPMSHRSDVLIVPFEKAFEHTSAHYHKKNDHLMRSIRIC